MADFTKLPLILAGPILRRVEKTRVCVWIALSRQALVNGFVYNAAATNKLGFAGTSTLKIGEALHVALVEMKPSSGGEYPTNPPDSRPGDTRALLAYDLQIDYVDEFNQAQTRLVTELTSNGTRTSLAYGEYSYPTFFIDDTNLNVLHGSCRKAHGVGDDALTAADRILQKTHSNLSQRPSSLFLTGDQIYADDVHDAIIRPAAELGYRVLGFEERIPSLPPVRQLQPKMRRFYATAFFTPGKGVDNQLLGFGDFVGMYLLAFNEALWPKSLAHPDLDGFRSALPFVRKALANLATYMVMDDHEICDDWNISGEWTKHALYNVAGRRVIANGLCAYWLFQAWGNKPEAFDDKFRKTITEYFANKGQNGDDFERALIQNDQNRWRFVAPTSPPSFFIDSRTRRQPAEGHPELSSAVLDDDALRDLLTEASGQKGKILILVTQTPIFDVPFIQKQLENLPFEMPPIKDTIEGADLDRWHANRAGYYKILAVLNSVAPKWCVLLSGDVHYGFVARAALPTNQTDNTGKKIELTFAQFTSSALRNTPTVKSPADFAQLSFLTSDQARNPDGVDEVGWMQAPKPKNPRTLARIRQILDASPVVLTGEELVDAQIPYSNDDPKVMRITHATIRPTNPSNGPCVHVRPNLGQIIITPNGRTLCSFYPPYDAKPFATYEFPTPIPLDEKVTLSADALFDFDRWRLKLRGRAKIDDLVSKLRDVTIEKITVVGYTDWIGTEDYNLKLSRKRAEAVQSYLIQKDVDEDVIEATGMGEQDPVADNNTAEGRALNRRVEIKITGTRPSVK